MHLSLLTLHLPSRLLPIPSSMLPMLNQSRPFPPTFLSAFLPQIEGTLGSHLAIDETPSKESRQGPSTSLCFVFSSWIMARNSLTAREDLLTPLRPLSLRLWIPGNGKLTCTRRVITAVTSFALSVCGNFWLIKTLGMHQPQISESSMNLVVPDYYNSWMILAIFVTLLFWCCDYFVPAPDQLP